MKETFPFRASLTSGGEILTQPATFLPVQPGRLRPGGEFFLAERRHLTSFLPVLDFKPENSTVAQPLLKEACDEMR
jgi:hypothetical protein